MYPQNIRIENFFISDSGSYTDQWSRAYVTDLQGTTHNAIMEAVGESKAIVPATFVGIANQFIKPSAVPERQLLIPNGFSARRFIFMLVLNVEMKTGGNIKHVMTGWADSNDAAGNYINPNLVWHINNVVQIRTEQHRTPSGYRTVLNPYQSDQVLVNPHWQGFNSGTALNMMRPSDIYAATAIGDVMQFADPGSMSSATALMQIPQMSRQSDAVATSYLADVLGNYQQAVRTPGVASDNFGADDIITNAMFYAKETSASTDPFIQTIASLRDGPVSETFTINDLERVDPTFKFGRSGETRVTKLNFDNETRALTDYTQQVDNNWADTSFFTQYATIIANSVPAIMLQSMLTEYAFTATNMTNDGSGFAYQIGAVGSPMGSGVNLAPFSEQCMIRIRRELLDDLSFNNSMPYMVTIKVALFGDIDMTIQLNGQERRYVRPAWMSSMATPVITNNGQQLDINRQDIGTLLSSISDSVNESFMLNSPSGLQGSSNMNVKSSY